MTKKECEKCEFPKNPAKAEARLHINSFLMGGLLTVLALIFTFSPEKFHIMVVAQLALAIPLILFASLSYAKVGYKENHTVWDRFGWIATNLGYILFLNASGLILAAFSFKILTIIYFGLVMLLVSIYYILNIISQKDTLKEHLSKLILWLIGIFIGGILPLM